MQNYELRDIYALDALHKRAEGQRALINRQAIPFGFVLGLSDGDRQRMWPSLLLRPTSITATTCLEVLFQNSRSQKNASGLSISANTGLFGAFSSSHIVFAGVGATRS